MHPDASAAAARRCQEARGIPVPGTVSQRLSDTTGQPARPALARAVVDLAAIAHNTRLLAQHARGELMAVVKADGFGHGAVQVARHALAHGASWLGVACVAEALALRTAGITQPVLAWLYLTREEIEAALAAAVDLSVACVGQLRQVAAAAEATGIPARIHLKIDTGLRRGGAEAADWPQLICVARGFEQRGLLDVHGVWSHLIHADRPTHPDTAGQIRAFDTAVAQAEDAGLRPALRHLANSAAALDAPVTHYDLARAGLGLYGIEPVTGAGFGLRPALTLHTRVLMTRGVAAGKGVCYGHDYTTPAATTLALVPVGFADGLPRAASPGARMWLAGERRPVVGRIAMDQCVLDAGAAAAVGTGDEVIVFGPGHHGEPTVKDWARWAGTSPHEILTGIGPRVLRHYQEAPHTPHHLLEGRTP
ncbi:alanine racemase [Streptomyces spinoverrucosus]|uniref:Alanine racemase n=1 Tax=Streptomyces spinoverrucosus TaxID=284043 RepID=A0A4Y3VVS5_9ACTN|nr:alanine racemase [Streptomyces spinoverrucosus]GEC10225.1 alanine racemase [Streptomyces spinoverrucosus]GHB96361.1 alanine racemase [Streptomyces spinoverrucosus]